MHCLTSPSCQLITQHYSHLYAFRYSMFISWQINLKRLKYNTTRNKIGRDHTKIIRANRFDISCLIKEDTCWKCTLQIHVHLHIARSLNQKHQLLTTKNIWSYSSFTLMTLWFFYVIGNQTSIITRTIQHVKCTKLVQNYDQGN